MTNFYRLLVLLILVVCGPWAACQNWLWAKGFIAVWALLVLSTWLPPHDILHNIQRMILFMVLFFSLSCFAWTLVPQLHFLFIILTWIGMIVYVYSQWNNPGKSNPPWPSPLFAVSFVIAAGMGFMLLHATINLFLHKPFHLSEWTSTSWMAIAFLLMYSAIFHTPPDWRPIQTYKKTWTGFFVILCILIYGFHQENSRVLRSTFDSPTDKTGSYQQAVKRAIRMGYRNIAMQAILLETDRLTRQGSLPEAVTYYRSMWEQIDKELLAYSFLNHEKTKNNLFLFTACYGIHLKLRQNEQTIDFAIDMKRNTFLVLTSLGRVLSIHSNGISTLYQTDDTPVALAAARHAPLYAILTTTGTLHLFQPALTRENLETLQLSANRTWKDLSFDPGGTRLWVLDGQGRIDAYRQDSSTGQWALDREVYPPLWEQPDIAQAFLFGRSENEIFIVLDAVGGLHWRSKPFVPPGSPLQRQFNRYYNPHRRVASNLGYWEPESAIMYLENSGRTYFFPVPQLDQPEASIPEMASATYEETPPIHSLLYFDPGQSTWVPKAEVKALAFIPTLRTIYQLHNHGTIEAILMPQRFHIRLTHPNRFLINTTKSEQE